MTDSAHDFLTTADHIGRRLCRDALWSGNRCNWLGWGTEREADTWVPAFRTCGYDLYDGTSGILLFLAHLSRYTSDKYQRRTVEGGVNQVLARLPAFEESARIGLFTGTPGAAMALIAAGQFLEHEALIERAIEELVALQDVDLDESMIDVIRGCAGAIPLLLDVAARFQRGALIELAIRFGEHLLRHATKSDDGWSWETMGMPEQQHLTGFAHGAAGIATALLELDRASGEEQFRQAAEQGIRYERTHFSPQHANWPDFREFVRKPDRSPSYMTAWCHGAAGIGMSRLRCLQLCGDDPAWRAEIEAAIATTEPTLHQPLTNGGNYSLCHGCCGNAELMLLAADILDRPDLRGRAEDVGVGGIEHIENHGLPWPSGTMNGLESPSFMLGQAGIGYYYLRLHDTPGVPSILLISPTSGRDAD